jgi:polyisoprenoid-binding protein YceI
MATTSAQTQIPTTGTYVVDPAASTVAFKTKHMFGTGTVKGTFSVQSGRVVISDPPTASSVEADVRADSVASGQKQRDKDVRSKKFLHAERFPLISLRGSQPSRNADGTWTLPATLTARGVSAPLELTITSAVETGGRLSIVATGTVDRYAHGITGYKGVAARRLEIEITATATRTAE